MYFAVCAVFNFVIVIFAFRADFKGKPVLIFFSNIPVYNELLFFIPLNAGKPGKPGRVLILRIYFKPVLLAYAVQIIHPFSVFVIICSFHLYNCMQAFPARMDQAGHRQLQLPDDRILLLNFQLVRFYKGIFKICHIGAFYVFSVQWVETDPRSCFRIVISEYTANITLAF